MKVSACLVTRGNVPMQPIMSSLAGIADEIDVWDNSFEQNEGVFGRYLSIERASHEVVFVQDDDCLLPSESIRAILSAYEPGRIVANMPDEFRKNYTDSCLIGFGAVFDRDLPEKAFARFGAGGRKRPDVVFTTLTPFTLVDVPFEHLPYAFADDRMYRQRGHAAQRHRTLAKARRVRDK